MIGVINWGFDGLYLFFYVVIIKYLKTPIPCFHQAKKSPGKLPGLMIGGLNYFFTLSNLVLAVPMFVAAVVAAPA